MDYLSNAFLVVCERCFLTCFMCQNGDTPLAFYFLPPFFIRRLFFISFFRLLLSSIDRSFSFIYLPPRSHRIRLAVVSLNFSRLISLCHEICSPRPRRRGSTMAGLRRGPFQMRYVDERQRVSNVLFLIIIILMFTVLYLLLLV